MTTLVGRKKERHVTRRSSSVGATLASLPLDADNCCGKSAAP